MLRLAGAFAALLTIASAAHAQEGTTKSPSAELTKRASTLMMSWQEDGKRPEPTLLKTPVLRCNDLTRDEVDGALWLWLEGKRPIAAMCLLQFGSGKWNYEFVSLTDDGVTVTGRPGWKWEPKPENRKWTKLEEVVPQAARARQQMLRNVARNFEAIEVHRGETFVLRLLDRPLYTYSDEAAGILEGGIFALTNGTNPETLMQLEARRDKIDFWQASFARLGSAALTVKLAGKEVWSVPARDARNPREAYFGINEAADAK